jgi:hypothetical protein
LIRKIKKEIEKEERTSIESYGSTIEKKETYFLGIKLNI